MLTSKKNKKIAESFVWFSEVVLQAPQLNKIKIKAEDRFLQVAVVLVLRQASSHVRVGRRRCHLNTWRWLRWTLCTCARAQCINHVLVRYVVLSVGETVARIIVRHTVMRGTFSTA